MPPNRIIQIGGSNSLFSAVEDTAAGNATTGYPVKPKVYDEDVLAAINTLISNARNIVDSGNSSDSPLLANGVFTGAWKDVLEYDNISVAVSANVASATNGLAVQWSMDGVNVHDTDIFSILANAHKQFTFGVAHRYYRVVYTNGASAQNSFHLQSILHITAPKPSSHRVQDTIVDDDDGELVISVLKLRTAQNNYVSGAATNSGNFKVSLEEVNGVSVPVELNPQSVSVDAGGFLRTATQTTLFDGKILNADDTNIWETVGTGTGSFSNNKYNMNVTSGQWLVRQSERRLPYFAGKSQRVEETFDKFAPQANVVKRFGYFSSNAVSPYASTYDGFWLESDGTTIYLKASRAGTSTLSVAITSWSGYANLAEYQTLSNWDNFTVVEFKFLWLGGAVLVLSVKTSGGFVEAHRFDYAGTAQDVFMLSPNQPLRYEIRSTTGSGDFRYICSQVATEGSIDESGESIAPFATTAIATNTIGTMYALAGLKKQVAYRDTAIRINSFSVANTALGTDAGILFLVINPTLSAALTYANLSRFQIAYATNQTITAGTGRVIAAFPAVSTTASGDALQRNYLAWLSMLINNTPDEYVIGYMPITQTQSVYPVLNIMEH